MDLTLPGETLPGYYVGHILLVLVEVFFHKPTALHRVQGPLAASLNFHGLESLDLCGTRAFSTEQSWTHNE